MYKNSVCLAVINPLPEPLDTS